MNKKNQNKNKSIKITLGKLPPSISTKQILFLLQRTPRKHIYTRPGRGGQVFEYVTGAYIKKVLNYVFGWMWDFEIIDKGITSKQVWVQGRLTIKNQKGEEMIVKEQFGRADIKFLKGTKEPVDLGNDYKAAATDALKKCASELGIASDVYARNEFKEIKEEEIKTEEQAKTEKKVVEKTNKNKKVEELKKLLKGKTEKEKMEDLTKRTGIKLKTPLSQITDRHAEILINQLKNK